jgi:hypothetical protein
MGSQATAAAYYNAWVEHWNSKAAAVELAGTVIATIASTMTYEGEVEILDSGAAKVKFKKPRSSKYQTSIFLTIQNL